MPFDINDPETKAGVEAAIAEHTKGLTSKHDELLDEVKALKTKLRSTQEISPEDLTRLENENHELSKKLAAADKTVKELSKAKEIADTALEAESKITHHLIAETGLVAALTKAGITDPAYIEAAKAMNLPNVKVVADGETRKAMFGDKELDAAIADWAGSDTGKKFRTATANGGGGAQGDGGAKGNGKTISRADYEASPIESAKLISEGAVLVDQ